MNNTLLNIFKISMLGIIIPLMIGCSKNDELTRDKAAQLIKEAIQYPKDLPLQVCNTRISVSQESQYSDRINYYHNYFGSLQNVGVLTYRTETEYDKSSGKHFTVFIATFTEKGQPFVVGPTTVEYSGQGNQYFNVKTGTIVFGEITGIIERKELSTAEVNYTELVNVTPFGQVFGVQYSSSSRNATFTKYDDGWRINN